MRLELVANMQRILCLKLLIGYFEIFEFWTI